ncbi:hypothetical protein J5O04_08145 [Corynebacterium hindlerae]|uniref:hypothetical protein n=1 Tax=Corynebacterium hindlerae TaxID=699041 RepID=UPI001AD750E9|nr:hypothetical protein [Corynebacterium hindlerae]QTH58808.1 hypothetical protein J5O04_08145 [Corynebacterium hindlerae]
MTIRTQFQSDVDEFISDLQEFASGSYLREEEREFWDQPFDPAVLPQLREILEAFLDSLDALPEGADADTVNQLVGTTISAIDEFNAQHADAVVEPEEREELNALFRKAVAASAASNEALSSLPELE